ncbi:hypothetical protein Pint_33670 [Pistacia integerrima]|uniref:Uncharacterized protein n=1 Tax=Pistacia integerrima TaxID=434235 RepID=A0ACC0X4D3_9ROSI|nr:hypothetical protein Pint_33670 [Pistacia integerrima]
MSYIRSQVMVLRYVGVVDAVNRKQLRRYKKDHPFAQLSGSDNIIAFTRTRYKEQPLVGRAGAQAGLPPGVLKIVSGYGPTVACFHWFYRILSQLRYIRSGIESNATLDCEGDRFGTRGYFVQPSVFSNVQDNMLIAQDEIFGPVQSILKFSITINAYRSVYSIKQMSGKCRLYSGSFCP